MDRVLTLNVGSSSFKWSLFDERDARIDGESQAFEPDDVATVLDALAARIGEVDLVAHRIVHGGSNFRAPVVVDRHVRGVLDEMVELDAIHMRPALAVLDGARSLWEDAVHVAAFDTAFHATLDDVASTYAVPVAWREKYGVRRYGFHGLSVEYAVARARDLVARPMRRMIVLHLGSGASATAVLDGRSVDTTMGMTPLEGIVMATRSGSIDPGVLLHLLRAGLDTNEIEEGLSSKGGLLALAGKKDMRAIAASTDDACRLARAYFIRSVAKHACSMLPALGGLDAVVFTGGIGENDAELRAQVTASLGAISSSPVVALVIHAREDISLLHAARQASCIQTPHGHPETDSRRNRLQ